MLNDYLMLSRDDQELQLETVINFLKAVHPTLRTDSDYRPCIELRPLIRKTKSMAGYSFNLWDLNENTISRLRAYLNKLNGQQVCLFYSVHHFDNNKEIVLNNGEKQRQNRITAQNAVGTFEIALDFDHIDYDEYISLVDRFEDLGIFALWVFSGHGYQAHILLDEELRDTHAIKNIVSMFIEKGFNCDPACVDSARVMRLPGTFNCKCFVDDKYIHEQQSPPRCEIVQNTIARYSYLEIVEALQTIPSISIPDNTADIPENENISLKEHKAIGIDAIKYPHIVKDELPEPIVKMLINTPFGFRNNVLGFLIKFFKTYYKLGKDQIEDILLLWGREACSPVYKPEEFQRDFSRLYYKYDGLSYNSKLAEEFGQIDFSSSIKLRKKDILIPHSFNRDLNELEGKSVRIYLALKLLEHNQEDATQKTLAEKLDISVRALRPGLQALLKSRHAYVDSGNRRLKIPDTYHSNKIFAVKDGYSVYSYNDLDTYLRDFAEKNSKYNELKLYLFFRYKFYTGEIYMSQTNIGKHIGVAQNTVSDIVNRLVEKKYLKISKKYHSPAVFSLEYTLLR